MSRDPNQRFQTARAFKAALLTVAQRLEVGQQLSETTFTDQDKGPPMPVAAAENGTLRLSDESKTQTALPTVVAQPSGVSVGVAKKILAFALSAGLSAVVTWWCLAALFHQ